MLQKLDLSNEQFRSVVLEVIRQNQANQVGSLITAVATHVVEKGLVESTVVNRPGRHESFCGTDATRVQNIFWDLLIEGVIRPGLGDGMNNDLPFFHVTEWGKKALVAATNTPYDPDGYLERLRREIPGLDSVIVTYLNESLHTFRIGCLLSSTIALGCASEKALLLLIAAYTSTLPEPSQSKFRKDTEGRMIKRQFDEFRKILVSQLKVRLPVDLYDGLDIELSAIFDIIRNQRNDAGHPTGMVIERERAYANLVVVPVYFKKVYSLIGWLEANPVT